MGFVFLVLTYRLALLLAKLMPVNVSWLVFQFAATWAFTCVTGSIVHAYARSLPDDYKHHGFLVSYARLVIVLACWLSFLTSLFKTLFAPQRAAPMAWFLSPKAAEFIPYSWALSLAVISVRLAPALLLVIDSVGWLWGPIFFLGSAVLLGK